MKTDIIANNIKESFKENYETFLKLQHPRIFPGAVKYDIFKDNNVINTTGLIKANNNRVVQWQIIIEHTSDIDNYIMAGLIGEPDIYEVDKESKIPTIIDKTKGKVVNYHRPKDVATLRILYLIHLVLRYIENDKADYVAAKRIPSPSIKITINEISKTSTSEDIMDNWGGVYY